jgi:hypothetical protein
MQSMRRIHGSLACRRFSKVSLHVTAGLPECASLRCQGHSPLPDHHGGCRPYAKQHLETLSDPVRGEDMPGQMSRLMKSIARRCDAPTSRAFPDVALAAGANGRPVSRLSQMP